MSTAPLRIHAVAAVAPEVSVIENREKFRVLEREWNDLVAAQNDIVFLRHEFLISWLESFAPGASLRILTNRSFDGRLSAALPLIEERDHIRGIPIRQLTSMSNEHSCRFDMVAQDPAEAGRAFLRYLEDDADWDVLRLCDVPEGGQAWAVYQAAMSRGFLVGAWESQRSPFLSLPSSEEDLQGRVSSQLRSNARRRLRQMEKKGNVVVERVQDIDVTAVLDDFFRLESSGWKGREGTACIQEDDARNFYTRFASIAAKRGWLSLYRLSLDGQSVAFHYGLTYGNNYFLPKLAFDEAFSDLSPGLVLMHEVLRDCVARNVDAIDFLGSDDEWKLRWSRTVLPHYWLYIFRNNFKGRLLHRMKFSWGPWVKRVFRA